MSGVGLLLSVAKDALLTQQYAMDVSSHNIANVNTDGFSRQTAVIGTKGSAPYGGYIFGRGAELQDIQRQVDTFVETSLRDRTSDHAAMTEKETYLTVLEGVFDENSGRSISSQLEAFWSAWHDVSNNPAGSAERAVLYESGAQLSQSFRDIRNDLDKFDLELDLSLEAGAQEINQITAQIATLNEQIVPMETQGNANDLRDQRDNLIRRLSEHLDIQVFEGSEGHVTVSTKRGYTLVSKTDSYELSFENDAVRWQGSSGTEDITDSIQSGKMGGWLDVRDELIPKYRTELDELASTTILEINKVHSQGVGLKGMSSATGSYRAEDTGAAIAASGLEFAEDVESGSFTLWVYNADGSVRASDTVTIADPDTDTLEFVRSRLDGTGSLNAAFTSDNRLELSFDPGDGASLAFSGDDTGVLAALGINTFFTGRNAQDLAVNDTLKSNKDFIAAGRVDTTGIFYSGDNVNALAIAALRETGFTMERTGYDGTSTSGSDTLQGFHAYLAGSVGIKSASVRREQEYTEVVVSQLTEKRNNLSAVSLDEEMTNMIKYQHAYAAAAKLVSTADEMLHILLGMR